MPLKYEPVYPVWVIVLFLLIHIHAHRDCISCCLLIFTSSSSKPQFLVQIQNYLIKTMTSIRMAQTKNNNKYLICNNKNKVTSAHKNEKKHQSNCHFHLLFSSLFFVRSPLPLQRSSEPHVTRRSTYSHPYLWLITVSSTKLLIAMFGSRQSRSNQ